MLLSICLAADLLMCRQVAVISREYIIAAFVAFLSLCIGVAWALGNVEASKDMKHKGCLKGEAEPIFSMSAAHLFSTVMRMVEK